MLQLKMSRRRSSKSLNSIYDNRYDDFIEGDEEIFISLAASQRLNDSLQCEDDVFMVISVSISIQTNPIIEFIKLCTLSYGKIKLVLKHN
ncbi:unnamed protein product [Rotaria sp. Silwood1]|nr:unnamed protein product [Rotaria sp. Silwood1]CAF5015313.1 unnamed protein product [Rotaria sp. Silwood1]